MKRIALISLLLTSLVACQAPNPNTPPPAVRADPVPKRAYAQQVAIEGVTQYLVSGDPIVTPSTEDQPMRVIVPVRSITDRELNLQYQFIFYDAQGRELHSNQGWVFQHIEPRVERQIETVSLESAAKDWRLIIRPAH